MNDKTKLFLEAKEIFREAGIDMPDKDIEQVLSELYYFIETMIEGFGR